MRDSLHPADRFAYEINETQNTTTDVGSEINNTFWKPSEALYGAGEEAAGRYSMPTLRGSVRTKRRVLRRRLANSRPTTPFIFKFLVHPTIGDMINFGPSMFRSENN